MEGQAIAKEKTDGSKPKEQMNGKITYHSPIIAKKTSCPEDLGLESSQKSLFAYDIVRAGAEHDLKNDFEGLSEAVRYYRAASELNKEDLSFLEIYIGGLTNLRHYAIKEGKLDGIIKGIETDIAHAQKRMEEDFQTSYQPHSLQNPTN